MASGASGDTSAGARSARRARSRRGEGEQLRAELLAAADHLLEEAGDPAAVTVRGVAGAVGVAPNAVYLHFADRDALLAEVATRTFEAAAAAVLAAVEGVADPLDRLRAGHAAYCTFALERPGHYRLMFGGAVMDLTSASGSDRLEAAGSAFFAVLVDACAACTDAGLLTGDPSALAASIWALEHGWCDLQLTGVGELLPGPVEALETLLGASAPRAQ